jgi:hypothetical protein
MCIVLNAIYQNPPLHFPKDLHDLQSGLEICLAPFANDCLSSEAETTSLEIKISFSKTKM